MSWFDTKGLANFAKTALIQAQKQIDKALEIEDDEVKTSESSSLKSSSSSGNIQKNVPSAAITRSKTEPSTPSLEQKSDGQQKQQEQLIASTWGSFSGSFFENPNARDVMVTTAPKAMNSSQPPVLTSAIKRNSMTPNSDSIDLLSPTDPATPSVSDLTMNISESVEVINTTNTSNITTPDDTSPLPINSSSIGDGATTTDSIVIIDGSNDSLVDDEEDSLSYNTVLDDTLTPNASTIIPNSQSSMISVLNTSKMQTSEDASTIAMHSFGNQSHKKRVHSGEEPIDSDSTQSFEEVHMLSSSAYSQNSSKEINLDDDKFDVSKVTSLASSPHNSNDEAETRTTTTSSDIEIISNPNGDSSSTHSANGRFSNLKQKKFEAVSVTPTGSVSGYPAGMIKKGHCREPSEISILSEDSQSESEKLLHRISELSEQLEAREAQLLQCERQNAALHEHNSELQVIVDTLRNNAPTMDPTSEDYTQRLSALEKKFQASIRERDALRIQINSLKEDLRSKIPKEELQQVKAESDTIIAELRLEGEKLSKEILQQSNIIKKLRAKEKSCDGIIKKNTAQIDDMTDELERLKKTLNAKEEVERTQIEAVHKISNEKRKLEEEHAQQRSKIEDLEMKLNTLQASFDAVKSELQQRSKMQLDLSRTADEAQAAKKEIEALKSENETLNLQLNEFREKLRQSKNAFLEREQQLREENRQLLSRLEAAELRADSSTEEVTLTMVPLMRQLESLQNTLSQRAATWSREEKLLMDKLEHTQNRLKSLENVEVTYKEKVDLLQARCMELEEKLSGALLQADQTKIALQQKQIDSGVKEENLTRQIQELRKELEEHIAKLQKIDTLNKSLEDQVHSMKAASLVSQSKRRLGDEPHSSTDDLMQRKLNDSMTSSTGEAAANASLVSSEQRQQGPSGNSPANSVGFNSLEEAMGGNFDWQDDSDCISNSGARGGSLALMSGLNFMSHNNATTLEHLQSLLKQRDGELHQLQWELSRMQAERSVLNEEISSVTNELENLKEKLLTNENLEKNYEDLQHRYDALLQMYGEKVERTEELELDLFELKESYKIQIEEVLAKQNKRS